jgi:hypothetical protein
MDTELNTDVVQILIAEAVKAERERIRAEIRRQMDQQQEYWDEGMEDTARKRSFALGRMAGLHSASKALGDDILPVHPPTFWATNCNHLGV